MKFYSLTEEDKKSWSYICVNVKIMIFFHLNSPKILLLVNIITNLLIFNRDLDYYLEFVVHIMIQYNQMVS